MNTIDVYIPEYMTENEQRSILEFIKKLQMNLGQQLLTVVLFGSRAKRVQRAQKQAELTSDMDLMVVLSEVDADVRETVRHLAADVWLENGIFLSTRVWNLEHWQLLRTLQTGLYQNICHDGIALFSRLDEPVLA
jgi:predicted nucleotidyltransferase